MPLDEPNLRDDAVKILNRVLIYIEGTGFFSGVVSNILVDPNGIKYNCIDWIGFCQYRNNRGAISYGTMQQNDALQQFYDDVNTKYPLPFTL